MLSAPANVRSARPFPALCATIGVLACAPLAGAQTTDGGGSAVAAASGIENVSPDASSVVGKSVTVEGSVTDADGIAKVEYRTNATRRWRSALLTEATDDDATTRTAADFIFRVSLRSDRETTRVFIRVIDVNGGESDYLSRKFRRDEER